MAASIAVMSGEYLLKSIFVMVGLLRSAEEFFPYDCNDSWAFYFSRSRDRGDRSNHPERGRIKRTGVLVVTLRG